MNKLLAPERLLRFIRQNNLVESGQKLVVAVSGGPDSVCLLYMLVKLQKELDIKLHVAHLDHRLRGADSEADARYVGGLARRLNVPATIESSDVKSYRRQHHISLEEAAREVRYDFLARVAGSVGAERVAVGHTADDHVETILMHLIRGSGTRGLVGLKPLSGWKASGGSVTVIRPLLEIGREETAAYCRENRLRPRLDISNLSVEPLRNKIRHQLLPLLRRYNPRVTDSLLRLSRTAGDDITFIDAEVFRLMGKVASKEGGMVVFDRAGFSTLPSALKRHILRTAIEGLLGDLKDVEARHIEEVLEALVKSAGKKIDLPGGLTFTTEYDRYLLSADPASISPLPSLETGAELKIPGVTYLKGWVIEAEIADPHGVEVEKADRFSAWFDFEKTGNSLAVRQRRPGDRFQPLGMAESKKLNEFMIDARIPQAWRPRVPIVCSPEQILWVVGWRIDERVKVTAGTKKVLCLKFERRQDLLT